MLHPQQCSIPRGSPSPEVLHPQRCSIPRGALSPEVLHPQRFSIPSGAPSPVVLHPSGTPSSAIALTPSPSTLFSILCLSASPVPFYSEEAKLLLGMSRVFSQCIFLSDPPVALPAFYSGLREPSCLSEASFPHPAASVLLHSFEYVSDTPISDACLGVA